MTNRLASPPEPRADMQVIAIVKGTERFIFLVTDSFEVKTQLTETLARWAANPDLNFSWYDAGMIAGRVQKGTH